jgi:hypothetical protein
VLPTLIIILGAYLVYALIKGWPRRRRGVTLRGDWGRCPRFGGMTLARGVGLGMALFLWFSLAPDHKEGNLTMAGFMGTGWAGSWTGESARPVEYPVTKAQAAGDRPVYALLHPETPLEGLGQEKAASAPRSRKKPKSQKLADSPGRGGKTTLDQSPKKEKVTATTRVPKKKQVYFFDAITRLSQNGANPLMPNSRQFRNRE